MKSETFILFTCNEGGCTAFEVVGVMGVFNDPIFGFCVLDKLSFLSATGGGADVTVGLL
jgi:hypothetical protein